MTPSDDLQRLVERIEGATGPDRELDARICIALGLSHGNVMVSVDGWCINSDTNPKPYLSPCYTGSIDAAVTLVPEGVNIGLHIDHNGNDCAWSSRAVGWQPQVTAGCVTPALALCAASLRARITQEQSNDQ